MVDYNIVANEYQRNLRVNVSVKIKVNLSVFFRAKKAFGELILLFKVQCFQKKYNQEFQYTEAWITDQNSKPRDKT